MVRDLGILFLHHTLDRVVRSNLASVRWQNPGAVIVTMSAQKKFRGGYTLAATPEIQRLHSANPDRSSDWLVCSWFQQRKERCRKWWIIEWDTFCAVPVREYYRPVWHLPFVASSVRLPHREPEWNWFRDLEKLPPEYRAYALGAVPFLFLLSERALRRVCTALLEEPFLAGNGELRFCTVANRCGFAPCGYSPPGDQITWITRKTVGNARTIYHPVKHLVPKSAFKKAGPRRPRAV